MPEVQRALSDARALTSRMANVLSSSNLHRENGSRIQNLHQEAIRLNSFQLPSSRIVGLVGDSGVGKSSLINSLLDRMELARAVSYDHAVNKPSYPT
jgi:putative ribosome biogenesis GTPase RsgA